MPDAIVLEQIQKRFGRTVAVRDLDLVVPTGALYGLIGPNGAGKTTTIRMIMSILFPDAGRLSVLGHGSALEAKDSIGYLPEERGVYKKMRAGAFLRYIGRLKGVPDELLNREIPRWLERVELPDVENRRCEELSKGMQQKLQFIAAVAHEPDLLILDEPFSGLDPINMRLLRNLILEQHRRGATVIFSTHVMAQAEQICEHLVMIHDGEKVLDAPLQEIRSRFDPRAILLEPREHGGLAALEALAWADSTDLLADGTVRIALGEGMDPSAGMAAAAAAVPAVRVEIERPSLEDIFVEIVGQREQRSTTPAVEGASG